MVTWLWTMVLLVFANCAFPLDIMASLTAGCFASHSIPGDVCQPPLKHVGPVPELLVPFNILYQLIWTPSVAQQYLSDIGADAQGDIRVYVPWILATFPQVKHFIKTVFPMIVLFFFTFSVTSTDWLLMSMTEIRNAIMEWVLVMRGLP